MKKYNLKAEETGSIELNSAIFSAEPNKHLIHELVVFELASVRQGAASVKTRGMVRGGGRKPRPQKGTGRARQGSIRSVQWVGGGVAHGPNPNTIFAKKINKKARLAALRSILSEKAKNGDIYVLSDYEMEKPSTSVVLSFMKKLGINKTLFMVDDIFDVENDKLYYSSRNIRDTMFSDVWELSGHNLLKYKSLVVTESALASIDKVLA